MAAEAIANKLGKKILKVSYADVESKYHGEGPKMVKAIFLAATNGDAVLFFDEADSLLSKRLTSVNQGSEQAINSMRSQLLICLEEFRGIVIFATNLVVNYDQAFLTRLISIEFPLPDEKTRDRIWTVHLKPLNDGQPHMLNIPLSDDIDIKELSKNYEFVGREIRNAVVTACVSVALAKRDIVTQEDLLLACERIVAEKSALQTAALQKSSNDIIKSAVLRKLNEGKAVTTDVFNEP
jgi:ATP-dependent 26S proteasome regulatory subunit